MSSERGLPLLNTIVVSKETGLCGDGSPQIDLPREQQKVHDYREWFDIVPPTVDELTDAYRRWFGPKSVLFRPASGSASILTAPACARSAAPTSPIPTYAGEPPLPLPSRCGDEGNDERPPDRGLSFGVLTPVCFSVESNQTDRL